MKLKVLFMLLFTILGVSTKAQWQGQQLSAEDRAYNEAKRMKKQLGLSDEQFKKVEEINLKYATKIDSMFKANGGFSPEMREKFKPIMEAKTQELKPVLTEEQLKKYEEMRQQMRNGGGGGSNR